MEFKKNKLAIAITFASVLALAHEVPRGFRNNNPGNIEKNPANNWQGKIHYSNDNRFEMFQTPEHGLRALGKLLINYQKYKNKHSIKDIITTFAPPSENDTEQYVDFIARALNIPANQKINLAARRGLLINLMLAIVIYENGYNIYTLEQYRNATAALFLNIP